MRRGTLATVVLAALICVPSTSAWSWPADGAVLRPFLFGSDPYGSGQHRGVDIAGASGSPVLAPAAGVVSFVGEVPGGGLALTIRTSDGYSVTLVHLGSSGVMRGSAVAEGEAVGTIGPTGELEVAEPYVHLGLRVTGEPHGYIDPLGLLPARPALPVAEPALPHAEEPAQEEPSATAAPESATPAEESSEGSAEGAAEASSAAADGASVSTDSATESHSATGEAPGEVPTETPAADEPSEPAEDLQQVAEPPTGENAETASESGATSESATGAVVTEATPSETSAETTPAESPMQPAAGAGSALTAGAGDVDVPDPSLEQPASTPTGEAVPDQPPAAEGPAAAPIAETPPVESPATETSAETTQPVSPVPSFETDAEPGRVFAPDVAWRGLGDLAVRAGLAQALASRLAPVAAAIHRLAAGQASVRASQATLVNRRKVQTGARLPESRSRALERPSGSTSTFSRTRFDADQSLRVAAKPRAAEHGEEGMDRRPLGLAIVLLTALAAVGLVALGRRLRAQEAENLAPIIAIDGVLRNNPHLLRERGAEHRQRVHDSGVRCLGAAPASARRGDVLPYRRRRAFDKGVPSRAGARTRPLRLSREDRRPLERAA